MAPPESQITDHRPGKEECGLRGSGRGPQGDRGGGVSSLRSLGENKRGKIIISIFENGI
jgi:hypothetical protein